MDAETRARAKERLKIASVILFTLPGIPCIYYGDEIGMEGYSDPFCRMPFQWNNIDEELLAHYRRLSEIRTKLSVFKDAEYHELFHDENCLFYERRTKGEVAVVAINMGYNKFDLCFEGELIDLFTGKRYSNRYTVFTMSYSILSNKSIF